MDFAPALRPGAITSEFYPRIAKNPSRRFRTCLAIIQLRCDGRRGANTGPILGRRTGPVEADLFLRRQFVVRAEEDFERAGELDVVLVLDLVHEAEDQDEPDEGRHEPADQEPPGVHDEAFAKL